MGTLISLSKSDISTCLSTSEYVLLIFALVVVVGLIGENKLPWWHPRLRLFEILVTVGCAGELLGDGGVFLFSRRLEALSDIEVGKARKESSASNDRAGKAVKEASEANERASRNKKVAAALRVRAAELELVLAKVKAWRKLDDLQRGRIVSKMQAYQPQKYMASVSSEPEATNLLDDVGRVLNACHWQVQTPTSCTFLLNVNHNICVVIAAGVDFKFAPSRDSDLGALSRAFANAISAEGVEARATASPELETTPSILRIIVGSKPELGPAKKPK